MSVSVSNINSFINQQYGLCTWKNRDTVLKRLICIKDDENSQILSDEMFYCDTPIFACKFSQQKGQEHLLALANEDGKLAIHDVTNKQERFGVNAHNNAIFDLAWMFNNMKIATVSGDHTAKLFDVSNSEIREERIFCGHSRSVRTVAFRKGDPNVFATGGRDGLIVIWDTRSEVNSIVGRPDRSIFNSHVSKSTPVRHKKQSSSTSFSPSTTFGVKSVTGLVFQDDNTLISCGAGDGIIKLWDIRKNYMTYKKEPLPKDRISYAGASARCGFSSLTIDPDGTKLYANCMDNTIYCYNIGTCNPNPVMAYKGHQNNTFYIKSALSYDGQYLVSGSSDDHAYIWNTKTQKPIVKLVGHAAEVTCVAWCPNENYVIVTCSDDMKHKIWRLGNEDLPENWEVIGRGKAELLPLNLSPIKSRLKRLNNVLNFTPPSCKRFATRCEKCSQMTDSLLLCESCVVNSSKRKNTTEDCCNENKRIQTDFGPRRLFSNLHFNLINENLLAKPLDVNDITNLKITTDVQKSFTNSPKSTQAQNSPSTHNTQLDQLSPHLRAITNTPKSTKLPSEVNLENSPTVNLPNYIVDGIAPHLNYSPPKKRDFDWLTKLRKEKSFRREIMESYEPSPPKIPKIDSTPTRSRLEKPSRSRCASPVSPLLKYFKVTSNKCENLLCSSKAHNCKKINSSPHSSQ